MYKHNPPTITIEFEHQIRNAYLWVEGSAWHDYEGIYKVQLNDVLLDEVSVLGLLTEEDLSDLTDAIEPAIIADAGERKATGSDTLPHPYSVR